MMFFFLLLTAGAYLSFCREKELERAFGRFFLEKSLRWMLVLSGIIALNFLLGFAASRAAAQLTLPLSLQGQTLACLVSGYVIARAAEHHFHFAAAEILPVSAAVALFALHSQAPFFAAALEMAGTCLGILVVYIIMTGLLDRMRLSFVPGVFAGAPVFFICLGILSLAFSLIF